MYLPSLFTNKVFLSITAFVALVWLFLWMIDIDVINVKGRINDKFCEREQIIKKEAISGVVVSKFKDERRSSFFKYASNHDTIVSPLGFLNDENFDHIHLGDTIIKEDGSLIFKIIRNGSESIHQLDLGCRDLKK